MMNVPRGTPSAVEHAAFDTRYSHTIVPRVASALEQQLERELEQIRQKHRERVCPPLSGSSRRDVLLADQPLVSFCSNDYLGLAHHAEVKRAAISACEEVGFGSGASRLVSGDNIYLRHLEQRLARFLDGEAVLVFPTGYQANIGALTALAGAGDLVVSDALNHASLIDGCRLSRAQIAIYKHANAEDAAQVLHSALKGTSIRFRRIFLVTESLFSMDGDVAPLAALEQVCRVNNASLIVDEAHALGCLGPEGRGLCAAAGVRPPVILGTFGKAFGAGGGFVASTQPIRQYLINRARTFIFTTALPAPTAAAAEAAVKIASAPEGAQLRALLAANITQLAQQWNFHRAYTPIVPVILGADAAAIAASSHMREAGLFVQAIRPPTVPEGSARLRLTLSASHTSAQINQLATALNTLTLASP